MKSLLYLLIAILLLPGAHATADDRFPQPPELQPDVGFWLAVFSDYSVDEGVLHDNRNLGVVYRRLDMPASLSRRERNRRVDRHRKEIRAVLQAVESILKD